MDEATKRQLAHGERLMRVLTQNERTPLAPSVEVAEFWALREGRLDEVPLEHLDRFEERLAQLAPEYADIDGEIRRDSGGREAG